MVISFVISPECVSMERISIEIHRLNVKSSTRNLEDKIPGTVIFLYQNVVFLAEAVADLSGIVRIVPENLLVLVDLVFGKAIHLKDIVFFCDAQHNNATCGVSEGRVCVPE
jgi:hypothetical protein